MRVAPHPCSCCVLTTTDRGPPIDATAYVIRRWKATVDALSLLALQVLFLTCAMLHVGPTPDGLQTADVFSITMSALVFQMGIITVNEIRVLTMEMIRLDASHAKRVEAADGTADGASSPAALADELGERLLTNDGDHEMGYDEGVNPPGETVEVLREDAALDGTSATLVINAVCVPSASVPRSSFAHCWFIHLPLLATAVTLRGGADTSYHV